MMTPRACRWGCCELLSPRAGRSQDSFLWLGLVWFTPHLAASLFPPVLLPLSWFLLPSPASGAGRTWQGPIPGGDDCEGPWNCTWRLNLGALEPVALGLSLALHGMQGFGGAGGERELRAWRLSSNLVLFCPRPALPSEPSS